MGGKKSVRSGNMKPDTDKLPTTKPKPSASSTNNNNKNRKPARAGAAAKASKPPADQDSKHQTFQQQKALHAFSQSLKGALGSHTFNATLQEVKSALFSRDFDRAFGSEEYLETYAARWSPTRALCYASVLDGIYDHLHDISRPSRGSAAESDGRGLGVLSVGGGAAEMVALGMFLGEHEDIANCAVTLMDSAPWASVVQKLQAGLAAPPPLPETASAAKRAANVPLVAAERLEHVTFKQRDVLSLGKEELASQLGSSPLLVTMLFTLNELFTLGGIGKTTTFLLSMTEAIPDDSLLLVIDSPGSYSETTLGKESKKYPMQWLLDKILLGTDDWEKVESHDSTWFRLSPRLTYPIPLEDMRYQMHLYRATKGAAN